MNWGIWARKAAIGALVAAGLALMASLSDAVQALMADPEAPAVIKIGLGAFAIHALGVAQNWIKHRKD